MVADSDSFDETQSVCIRARVCTGSVTICVTLYVINSCNDVFISTFLYVYISYTICKDTDNHN